MIKKVERERIANASEIPLLDDMECTIDNMISLEPVMCSKCQTVFCADCLYSWKLTSLKCPLRCAPFQTIYLKDTIFKTQLSKIKVKCIYDKFGCKVLSSIYDLDKHQKYCEYRIVMCEKCKKEISIKNQIEHLLNECNGNKFSCFICKEKFNYAKLPSHIKNCFALNEKNFFNNVNTIEKCNQCGMRKIKNEEHVCYNKNSLNEGQYLVNWVNTVEKFENYVKKYLQEFDKGRRKEWMEEEIMMRGIVDDIKEKINISQMKMIDDKKYIKNLNEECEMKRINKIKETKELLNTIEYNFKQKNIELAKAILHS